MSNRTQGSRPAGIGTRPTATLPPPPPQAVPDGQAEGNGNKPEAEYRLGRVKVVLWRNESDNGSWYNIQFRRLYKDDGQWRSADSFSRDDLPLIQKLADWAFLYCHQKGAQAKT